MDPMLIGALGIKMAGALVGSGCALAFQPPPTWRDFFQRISFAFVCGVVFCDPVRLQYLKWTDEMTLPSAALVALVAWPVFTAAMRLISAWKPK